MHISIRTGEESEDENQKLLLPKTSISYDIFISLNPQGSLLDGWIRENA